MRLSEGLQACRRWLRAPRLLDGLHAGVIVAGTIGLFIIDISMPRGILDGLGYPAIVALGARFGRRVVLACTWLVTALIILASPLVPDSGISVAGEMANRFFGLLAVWIVALVLRQRLGLQRRISAQEADLAHHQKAMLQAVHQGLLTERPFMERIQQLCEIAADSLKAGRVGVFRWRESDDMLACLDLYRSPENDHVVIPALSRNLHPEFQRAMQGDFVIVADDVLEAPYLQDRIEVFLRNDVRAVIGAGIVLNGVVTGQLVICNTHEPRAWTTHEIIHARAMANLVATIFAAERSAEMQARLQQSAKMEAIGQLASGVAHDFNNILGAITGFASFIAQDAAADSENREFAQRILSASRRGKDMVDQIMAFAETRSVSHGVVNLGRVVKTSRELLASSMHPGALLETALPEAPLLVRGNEVQIGQLIVNLAANGRDALNGGPGVVEIEAAAAEDLAHLAAFRDRESERLLGQIRAGRRYGRLTVRDNGGGIAPDILDRIFEPFFTTKGRQRGTGLGLAVVHGVIRAHDGLCHLVSEPGRGTCFSIYLPLVEDGADAPALSGDFRPCRVLIVDDEADMADMLAIGLERLGFQTVATQSPIMALAAIEEDPEAFDALLTDQSMPGMLGTDLIREARRTAPDLRMVLCTGNPESLDETRTRMADAILHKPMDILAVALAVGPRPGEMTAP